MLHVFSDLSNELKEIYRYRYVIYTFTQIKLKQRYRRSVLGYLWTIFTPLINYIIMGTVISFIARGAKIENYFFYFISASIFFSFFSNVVTGSFNCLIGNENFIKKIYFPKSIFFINVISLELINFFLSFTTLYLIALALGMSDFTLTSPLSLLSVFLMIPFLLGAGFIVGIGAVFFRDLLHIIPAILQGLYFITPILYSIEMAPEKYHALFYINPLYYFIESFRRPLMSYSGLPWEYLAICGSLSIFIFLVGFMLLKKMENKIIFKL